jgi:uncharacterized membrane protein
MLCKSIIYDKDNQQPIKEKIITQLWSVIIENHFQIIESFNEIQILKLTSHFVKEASRTEDNLSKWSLVLKRNISRITKVFATATVLQIISNIIEDIESGSIKTIIENFDIVCFLDFDLYFHKYIIYLIYFLNIENCITINE